MSTLWPTHREMDEHLLKQISAGRSVLAELPQGWLAQWDEVWAPVAAWIALQKKQLGGIPVIGIHGGQGSGKSTLSKALVKVLRATLGWNVVCISIDDLYRTHEQRQQLAADVHPLLATRGVPGTHDVELGIRLFNQLRSLEYGATLNIPVFDKASDDRLPEAQWHPVFGPIDLILFEGWCVGCLPVEDPDLNEPVNDLENLEDPDGRWRHAVNAELAGRYRDWFDYIDRLLMLKVPGMHAVVNWRGQQEVENKANALGSTSRSMDSAALARFIQHYERLTLNALRDLPERADLVVELNSLHAVKRII